MKAAGIPKMENQWTRFDSDSKKIRIDNCASYSISHDLEDFVKPPKAIDKRIKDIGGTLSNVKQGTIRWFIEDDSGKKHMLLLPNGLYLPESPSRLLSPQHWAQVANDHKPRPNGTLCITYADRVVLKWNQQRATKTIFLSKEQGNVASFYTAPGYRAYKAFIMSAEVHEDQKIANSKTSSTNKPQVIEKDVKPSAQHPTQQDGHNTTYTVNFDLNCDHTNESPVISQEEEILPGSTPVVQFLYWHYKLNHISPRKMIEMAKQGLLPRKLAKYPACRYGKATRQPWRRKPTKDAPVAKLRKAQAPGGCVSVDRLESTTPGLIAQVKVWITIKR